MFNSLNFLSLKWNLNSNIYWSIQFELSFYEQPNGTVVGLTHRIQWEGGFDSVNFLHVGASQSSSTTRCTITRWWWVRRPTGVAWHPRTRGLCPPAVIGSLWPGASTRSYARLQGTARPVWRSRSLPNDRGTVHLFPVLALYQGLWRWGGSSLSPRW